MQPDQLTRALEVLSGDRPIAVAVQPDAILSIGFAVFLAFLLALIIAKHV